MKTLPKETPLEDLRIQALAHYDEAASAVNHYSSFVKDAIIAYTPPYLRELANPNPEPSTEQSGGTEQEQNIIIEDLMNEFASDWVHKFDEIPDIYSEIRAKFIITRKPLDR